MKKAGTGRILSVRLSAPLERRLKARARRKKTTESALVRDLIARGLDSKQEVPRRSSVGERAGHLFGLIGDPGLPNARDAKKHLREWNPDRRG